MQVELHGSKNNKEQWKQKTMQVHSSTEEASFVYSVCLKYKTCTY